MKPECMKINVNNLNNFEKLDFTNIIQYSIYFQEKACLPLSDGQCITV